MNKLQKASTDEFHTNYPGQNSLLENKTSQAQCVKYSHGPVGANMPFETTEPTALCLAQCVKYSHGPVGANMPFKTTKPTACVSRNA